MIEFARRLIDRAKPEKKEPPPLYLLDEEDIPTLSKFLETGGHISPEVQYRDTGEIDENGNPITETVVELKKKTKHMTRDMKITTEYHEPITVSLDEISVAREWFDAVHNSHSDLYFALRNKDYDKDKTHLLPNMVYIGAGLARIERALGNDPQQRVLFES